MHHSSFYTGVSGLSFIICKFYLTEFSFSLIIHYLQGLLAMDSSGTSDPYVKLHLLPGASKVQSVYMHLL